MIRSAAKNHKDVSVLVDPIQYQAFLAEIKKGVLDEAYKNGIYEPPSYEMEEDEEYTDFDKLLTLQDLVRKAKYLQEIGKIDESLKYLDELIKSTSSRANYSCLLYTSPSPRDS